MTDKPNLADVRERAKTWCLNPTTAMAEAIADRKALLAAVDAVLAVHVPLNDLGSPPCAHCLGDEDGESVFVPWPCPTVRAVMDHMEVR